MKILKDIAAPLAFQKKKYVISDIVTNGRYSHNSEYSTTLKNARDNGKVALYGNKERRDSYYDPTFFRYDYDVVELDKGEKIQQDDLDDSSVTIMPVEEAVRFISKNARKEFFIRYDKYPIQEGKILDFNDEEQYKECINSKNAKFLYADWELNCRKRELNSHKIELLEKGQKLLNLQNKELMLQGSKYRAAKGEGERDFELPNALPKVHEKGEVSQEIINTTRAITKLEAEILELKELISKETEELKRLEVIGKESISDLSSEKVLRNIIIPQISKDDYWFGAGGSLIKY